MRSDVIQLLMTLLLIAGIVFILFFFLFKGGNISNKEFWRILLGLFIVVLLVLNLRPHWSIEKKHRNFFEGLINEIDLPLQQKLFDNPAIQDVDSSYKAFSKLIAGSFQGSVTGNNSVEIITDGHRKYELLLQDLENARESINMEYFHFGADKGSRDIRGMLIKKAQEGVKVKFINESIVNFPIGHRYYRSMKKSSLENSSPN